MRFTPIALGLLIFSVVCAHAFTPELIRGRHVCVYAGNLLGGRAYYGADGTYHIKKAGKPTAALGERRLTVPGLPWRAAEPA